MKSSRNRADEVGVPRFVSFADRHRRQTFLGFVNVSELLADAKPISHK